MYPDVEVEVVDGRHRLVTMTTHNLNWSHQSQCQDWRRLALVDTGMSTPSHQLEDPIILVDAGMSTTAVGLPLTSSNDPIIFLMEIRQSKRVLAVEEDSIYFKVRTEPAGWHAGLDVHTRHCVALDVLYKVLYNHVYRV